MATGDLRNNVSKLVREIRRMRLNIEVDTNGWCVGTPASFLPVLHSGLMEYSLPMSQWLVSRECTLYGKSDLRFLEGMYRILRTAFNYHPKLTLEQFLATGYAERKIMLTYDFLLLCQKKHTQLISEKRRALVNAEGYGCRPRPGAYGRHCEVLTVKDRRGLGSVWTENFPVTTCIEPQGSKDNHTPNHSPLHVIRDKSIVIIRHKSPVHTPSESPIHITSGSPVYTSPAPQPRSPSVTLSPPPQPWSPEVKTLSPVPCLQTLSPPQPQAPSFSADVTMSPTSPTCDCESRPRHVEVESTPPKREETGDVELLKLTDDQGLDIDKRRNSSQEQGFLHLNTQVGQLTDLVEKMSARFVLLETELTLARAGEQGEKSGEGQGKGGQRRQEELGGQRRETRKEVRKEVQYEVCSTTRETAGHPLSHNTPQFRTSDRSRSPDLHSTLAPISITPTISTTASPVHHGTDDETQQLIANLRNRALNTKLFLQRVIMSSNNV